MEFEPGLGTGRGSSDLDSDEPAVAAVLRRSAQTAWAVVPLPPKKSSTMSSSSGSAGELEDPLNQLDRLDRVEHILGVLERDVIQQGLLGVLGVADFARRTRASAGSCRPTPRRGTASPRGVVPSAPHQIRLSASNSSNLCLGDAPVAAARRAIDHPPGGRGDRVDARVVPVACRHVLRRPRSARVVVRVLVSRLHLLGPRQRCGCHRVLVPGVDDDVVVVLGEPPGGVLRRVDLLPDDLGDEVLRAEDLVAELAQVGDLVVVDRDEDDAVVGSRFRASLSRGYIMLSQSEWKRPLASVLATRRSPVVVDLAGTRRGSRRSTPRSRRRRRSRCPCCRAGRCRSA